LQGVVDCIFVQGLPAISTMTRWVLYTFDFFCSGIVGDAH
jgi:hypothetical protein